MFKKYREAKGLTQEKLSELVDIDIRTYQKIEADETVPLVNTFAKISLALNLDDKDIIKELKECAKIVKKKAANKH